MNWNSKEFWIDGGCKNNGRENPHAYGSISDGQDILRLEFPELKTNNQAEYYTLIELLVRIPSNSQPTIYTDSRLLIGQLQDGWKVKAQHLKETVKAALVELYLTKGILVWVPRKELVERLGH